MDISAEQRDFLLERHPALVRLLIADFTQPAALTGVAELVFSQAVLMHIHGRDRHRTMMRNMWRASSRYVLLVENWLRHDFVADVAALFEVPAYRVECDGASGILLDKQAGLDLPVWSDDHAIRAVS